MTIIRIRIRITDTGDIRIRIMVGTRAILIRQCRLVSGSGVATAGAALMAAMAALTAALMAVVADKGWPGRRFCSTTNGHE